jgi:hypothetical protein
MGIQDLLGDGATNQFDGEHRCPLKELGGLDGGRFQVRASTVVPARKGRRSQASCPQGLQNKFESRQSRPVRRAILSSVARRNYNRRIAIHESGHAYVMMLSDHGLCGNHSRPGRHSHAGIRPRQYIDDATVTDACESAICAAAERPD